MSFPRGRMFRPQLREDLTQLENSHQWQPSSTKSQSGTIVRQLIRAPVNISISIHDFLSHLLSGVPIGVCDGFHCFGLLDPILDECLGGN